MSITCHGYNSGSGSKLLTRSSQMFPLQLCDRFRVNVVVTRPVEFSLSNSPYIVIQLIVIWAEWRLVLIPEYILWRPTLRLYKPVRQFSRSHFSSVADFPLHGFETYFCLFFAVAYSFAARHTDDLKRHKKFLVSLRIRPVRLDSKIAGLCYNPKKDALFVMTSLLLLFCCRRDWLSSAFGGSKWMHAQCDKQPANIYPNLGYVFYAIMPMAKAVSS